jgi:transposase-like protein
MVKEQTTLVEEETKTSSICGREGIHQNMYYKWSKEFLEAGTSNIPFQYHTIRRLKERSSDPAELFSSGKA